MLWNRRSWSHCLLLAFLAANPPGFGQRAELPHGFGKRAFEHLDHLSSFGSRRAGSDNERRAVEYISTQLQKAGLEVEVEPFEFECFEWSEAVLSVGGTAYVPEGIGFNPYEGELRHQGELVLLDPKLSEEQFEKLQLKGAVIATIKTESPVAYFRLLPKNPKLIIQLQEKAYQEMAKLADRRFKLEITGSLVRYRSANVVGMLRAPVPTFDEIIVSAHLDSYKNSPGADDNGSGIGVMIELARHFKELKDRRTANMRFVAFGAEEVGVLGARVYLSRHEAELKNCRLVFNIDRVGGSGDAHIEALGGIAGIPSKKGRSQIPALIAHRSWEGLDSGWILNAPDLLPLLRASNRPPWLVNAIKDSIDETGLDVSLASSLGGDSLVFSQAGIVASGMAIGGNPVHSLKDTPGRINIQSLENCGRLVSTLLLKVMAGMPQ